MKRILTVSLPIILLFGCSKVAVVEPIGTLFEDSEATRFTGVWIDGNSNRYDVTYDNASDRFTITNLSDDETISEEFTVRRLTRKVVILWTEPTSDGKKVFAPFRVSPSMSDGEKHIALLVPDHEYIEEMIKDGNLEGSKLEEDDSWLLESDGVDDLLKSKAFWHLDESFIFIKEDANQASHTTPAIAPR